MCAYDGPATLKWFTNGSFHLAEAVDTHVDETPECTAAMTAEVSATAIRWRPGAVSGGSSRRVRVRAAEDGEGVLLGRLTWRRSGHSGGSGGNRVEVASTNAVLIRGSKLAASPACPVLAIGRETWRGFLTAISEH